MMFRPGSGIYFFLYQHSDLWSKDDQKHLITLCDRFINSGGDVTLAHLLDVLNTVTPARPQMPQYQQLEPIGKSGGWNNDIFL